MEPAKLANALRDKVAIITNSATAWREDPVTAREYATLIGEIAEYLMARREEAISFEHRALDEDEEDEQS